MNAHPTRHLILSIIRIIIWTVIAVALVKFAFFPNQEENKGIVGQGEFELPTVAVTRGSIENTQKFEATIARDASKLFKATAEGTITTFFVDEGAQVSAGDWLIQIRTEHTSEPTDPEGAPVTTYTYTNVTAPIAGTVHFDAIASQATTVGDMLGSVQPGSFHAAVQLTAEQLYSLQGVGNEATILIPDGPAPFTCTNVRTISTSTQTMSGDGAGTSTPQTTTPELHCDIPADQTVFEGLKAKLTITGEMAEDTLMLPVTAVEGRYREAHVYLPAEEPGAQPTAVTVQIGINDGAFVQITEGIEEGDLVLEFVPSIDPDEMMGDSMMMEGASAATDIAAARVSATSVSAANAPTTTSAIFSKAASTIDERKTDGFTRRTSF